ncbi:MAG: ferredoxin--NADP reductase [Candidatus Micrarchaeia archaeon]
MENLKPAEKKYFIYEKIDETKDVLVIRFKPEDGKPLNFKSGMFIMISGIDKSTGKIMPAKAFSIASDPASPILELLAAKEHPVNNTMHKTHFLDANINDPFIVKGPYGQFSFEVDRDKKVLFIAGGTGLAPFLSMLRQIKRLSANIDAVLFYSVRYPTDIIMKNELIELGNQLKLKEVITVTRPQPNDNWSGLTGHINVDMIKAQCSDYSEREIYICGPLAFVKAMQDCLNSLGVKKENVKADIWG